MSIKTNQFTAKLKSKKQLTRDVLELHFEKPPDFTYQAGQFVQWQVPEGTRTIWRSYSLASTPADPQLEFCLKILPAGKASALAARLEIGDRLTFAGPSGRFVNAANTPLYFIATGVGLAPIMGIIRDELENKKTTEEIRLLFGVRSEADIFWPERLEDLHSNYENFSSRLTISQPKPGGGWSGLRGRVTEHLLRHLVAHHFFICGNAAMVKEVREMLIKNGVNNEHIHFEIF